MALRNLPLLTLAALSLAGCSQVSEVAAMTSCLNRAEATFPTAKGLVERISDDIEGFGKAAANGDFHYIFRGKDGSVLLDCRGNTDRLVINEVTFDKKTVRPAANEQWDFE